MIALYMTATAVLFDADGSSDPIEELHGWVDPAWSYTVLHDDREDVRPTWTDAEVDGDDEGTPTATLIAQVLGGYGVGRSADNGERGNFYANSDETDDEGRVFSYCLHVEVDGETPSYAFLDAIRAAL